MSVCVAEYFGQRVDVETPVIPVKREDNLNCPFMDKPCDKLIRKNKPVCSVRKNDGTYWIVCAHRLCATAKKTYGPKKQHLYLNSHQKGILWEVAKTIYRGNFQPIDIAVSREVLVPLEGEDVSDYNADYVMRNLAEDNGRVDAVILEMQGGGETSGTKAITNLVKAWEEDENRQNIHLTKQVSANPIETNAWRRQQEQFLVKGNVANQSSGKLVFAVGTLLYDYLNKRFSQANLRDLRDHEWTLCILTFKEDKSLPIESGPIPLTIDEDRLLFTNYNSFVQHLTNQGGPSPEIFSGTFENLMGDLVDVDQV